MSGKELAKFGHFVPLGGGPYRGKAVALDLMTICGIRSAGISTVSQSAVKRPSRRISAPTILHSDPISLGSKVPWIERRVTKLVVIIPGWVETTPSREIVWRSPSFPSWIDFRTPAAATGALEGVPFELRRTSQVQKAGQTS